jgi:hypothetical protein
LATVEEVNIATLNRRDRRRGASVRGSDSLQLFYESSLRRWFSWTCGQICLLQVLTKSLCQVQGSVKLKLSGHWIFEPHLTSVIKI